VQPVSIYWIWQKSPIATVFALDERFRWNQIKSSQEKWLSQQATGSLWRSSICETGSKSKSADETRFCEIKNY